MKKWEEVVEDGVVRTTEAGQQQQLARRAQRSEGTGKLQE